jgi:hypothetical protein
VKRASTRVHELIRGAVDLVIHLRVIIDVHATRLPFRQLVACLRDGLRAGRSIYSKRDQARPGDLGAEESLAEALLAQEQSDEARVYYAEFLKSKPDKAESVAACRGFASAHRE